jgi:hypothetical protein
VCATLRLGSLISGFTAIALVSGVAKISSVINLQAASQAVRPEMRSFIHFTILVGKKREIQIRYTGQN